MAMISLAGKPLFSPFPILLPLRMDAMSHSKTCLSICCSLLWVGCAQLDKNTDRLPEPPREVVHQDVDSSGDANVGASSTVATVAYEDAAFEDTANWGVADRDAAFRGTNSIESGPPSFSDLVAINSLQTIDATEDVVETRYTLADLEQIAVNNNPSLVAAGATAGKASGLRNQIGLRPNPTLGYFGQQLADQNTDQHGVFVEQEFVRGNKLALNREVLGHTMSAQRWEMQSQRYRVLTDIRIRFYEAVAAQRRADATSEFATVARRGVQVAIDRQAAEEGNLIEVLQAKTLLSEIMLAAQQAELEYRGAWQDLAAVAGVDETASVRLVDDGTLPDSSPDWDAVLGEILAQSPELSVAQALVCEKYALLKRQRVQMVPNITAQIGAGYDRGTDSGMLNLQFGAPIPVWNKNSGNISAAYADYTRALENTKRIEQLIKSKLARASQEFESSMAAVTKYEEEIIPQTQQSLQLSEEAYRAGELDFLQVLIVRRSYYESAIRLISAQGRLAQANAQLDGLLLTGGLDAPADYTDGDGIRGASFGGQ